MFRILFVCHGNICRSPMAEFVFNDMVKNRGIKGVISESAATSTEEIGNGVHRGTARILDRLGIDYSGKRARQITHSDYDIYDLIIGMEKYNIPNIMRAARISADKDDKIKLLLDFTDQNGDIDDPWYSGDFEKTYSDIKRGCEGLLNYLSSRLT